MSSDDPTHDRPGRGEPDPWDRPAPPPPGGARGGAGDGPGAGGRDALDVPDPRGDADEVASALFDGLLGGADAAAASQRAEVRERLARLEATRRLVRDVPSPPPEPARERALAAALAAFDDDAEAEPVPAHGRPPGRPAAPGPAAPPASLADRRARKRQGAPRWLGAAAAVAVIAAIGAGLAAIGSSTERDADTTAMETSSEDQGGDAPAADSSEGGESGAGEAAPSPTGDSDGDGNGFDDGGDLGDLGDFTAAADLVDALRTRDTALSAEEADESAGESAADLDVNQRTAQSALADAGTVCDPLPDPLSAPDTFVRASAAASLDGDAVTALLVASADGSIRVVVVDGGCQIRADEPL